MGVGIISTGKRGWLRQGREDQNRGPERSWLRLMARKVSGRGGWGWVGRGVWQGILLLVMGQEGSGYG